MAAELALQGGKIGIEVEHAGIGVAEEADASVADMARSFRGVAPFRNLGPCATLFKERTRKHFERDTGASEGAADFGYAAG